MSLTNRINNLLDAKFYNNAIRYSYILTLIRSRHGPMIGVKTYISTKATMLSETQSAFVNKRWSFSVSFLT